jgi:hypothetical protein
MEVSIHIIQLYSMPITLAGLDGMSEEDIMKIIGTPETAKVIHYKGHDGSANPPDYLVCPAEYVDSACTGRR